MMPCESQPRWYCLEKVMRYRLNRQLIQGQIASVIQNKHGWHTTHRLDSALPRNCHSDRENKPWNHLAQYTKVMLIADSIGAFFVLYLKSEIFSKIIYSLRLCFFFFMFTARLFRCFILYFIGELREDKCFTTADTALDMEMSWYWF